MRCDAQTAAAALCHLQPTHLWKNATFRSEFWEHWYIRVATSNQTPSPDWLITLTFAVASESSPAVLQTLSRWPLPDTIPPAMEPWFRNLVAAWEKHRQTDTQSYDETSYQKACAAMAALVRLDGCATSVPTTRLAEWLKKDSVLDYHRSAALAGRSAALAGWQPPAHATPDPEHLRCWIERQGNRYRWGRIRRAKMYGVTGQVRFVPELAISTQALLNLVEARVPLPQDPHFSPENLITYLRKSIRDATNGQYHLLTSWQPTPRTPIPGHLLAEIATEWIDKALNSGANGRKTAWTILTNWEQQGVLHYAGVHLLPHLAAAARAETTPAALRAMARWVPSADIPPTHHDELQSIVTLWQKLMTDPDPRRRTIGYTAAVNLLNSGKLPADMHDNLWQNCTAAVTAETNRHVRLALAFLASAPDQTPDRQQQWRQAWQKTGTSPAAKIMSVLEFILNRQKQELPDSSTDAIRWQWLVRKIHCQMRQAGKTAVAGYFRQQTSEPKLCRLPESAPKTLCHPPRPETAGRPFPSLVR